MNSVRGKLMVNGNFQSDSGHKSMHLIMLQNKHHHAWMRGHTAEICSL